jgi:hypothetical protein
LPIQMVEPKIWWTIWILNTKQFWGVLMVVEALNNPYSMMQCKC